MKPTDRPELERAVSSGTQLYRRSFRNMDLAKVKLRNARLPLCLCEDVRFDFSDLTGVYAPGTVFKNCSFGDARLCEAYLRGAQFIDCQMRNTDFAGAVLSEAVFNDSDIKASNFSFVDLTDAAIRNVTVKGCRFFLADLISVKPEFLAPLKAELKGALLPAGL